MGLTFPSIQQCSGPRLIRHSGAIPGVLRIEPSRVQRASVSSPCLRRCTPAHYRRSLRLGLLRPRTPSGATHLAQWSSRIRLSRTMWRMYGTASRASPTTRTTRAIPVLDGAQTATHLGRLRALLERALTSTQHCSFRIPRRNSTTLLHSSSRRPTKMAICRRPYGSPPAHTATRAKFMRRRRHTGLTRMPLTRMIGLAEWWRTSQKAPGVTLGGTGVRDTSRQHARRGTRRGRFE